MIVLHQTVSQGKDEPCGIEGDPELDLAAELVERGFVCIVPDAIGFGERIPKGAQPYHTAGEFFRRHPRWSFFGKMAWDTSRIVDYLVTLPEVDPWRIGTIGHSHGGYGSVVGAALEPRIRAIVVSCGFNSLRADDHPDRWSHRTPLLPQFGFYQDDLARAPIDWHEIIATLAPRPFFLWMPSEDAGFPNTENFVPVFAEMKKIYGFYGAGDFFEPIRAPGNHSFPRKRRDQAYAWLERMLPARLDLTAPPASTDEWKTRRDTIRAWIALDLGEVDPPTRIGSSFSIKEWTTREGYRERKIQYPVEQDERISAYLLEPEARIGRRPGIVVFHQTVNEGKEEAAGRAGDPAQHFGLELARRGYIVLIPDSICAGERITASGPYDTRNFYARNPSHSAMAKLIRDGRRAISVLANVPGVDPSRLGVMGHSLGAQEALFVAAFDDRVAATVASCGFAPFAAEKNMDRWARDRWFSYMPLLRIDLRAGRLPAWDLGDVISLVAPHAYFNFQRTEDEIFPEGEAIDAVIESRRAWWALYGAEDDLVSRIEPGPHGISSDAKQAIYDWLDSGLKP